MSYPDSARREATDTTRATRSLNEELAGLAAELGIPVTEHMHAADVVRAIRASIARLTEETPVITLVTDTINDGVAIEVNGGQVWWENSFGSIDQFFLHSPDMLGRPVILRQRTDEEV